MQHFQENRLCDAYMSSSALVNLRQVFPSSYLALFRFCALQAVMGKTSVGQSFLKCPLVLDTDKKLIQVDPIKLFDIFSFVI